MPYDTFATTGGAFGNVDRDIDSRTAVLRYAYDPVGNDLVNTEVTLSYADQEIVQEYVEGSSPFAPSGGFPVVNADNRYETTKLTVKNTAVFDTGMTEHELRLGAELMRRDRQDAASAPGGRGTGCRSSRWTRSDMAI